MQGWNPKGESEIVKSCGNHTTMTLKVCGEYLLWKSTPDYILSRRARKARSEVGRHASSKKTANNKRSLPFPTENNPPIAFWSNGFVGWLLGGGLLFLTLLERLFFCTDFSCKKQLEQLVAFQTASEVRSMSIRGVRQLKEFVIRYSDYDGSSKHIRYVVQPFLQGTKSFFSSITYIAIFISSSFSYETVIGFALIWFLWHKQTPSFLLKQKSSDVNIPMSEVSMPMEIQRQLGWKIWKARIYPPISMICGTKWAERYGWLCVDI